jgi:hypothetical protein
MNFSVILQALKSTLVSKGLSDAAATARATTLFGDAANVFRTSVEEEARKSSPPNLYECCKKAQGAVLAWAQAVNP